MNETVRYRVRVQGRVQGVWFRESMRERATELGLHGWVRNLPDGSVEAVVEGSPHAADAMLAWMRHGPERALVTDISIHDEPPQGERGFRVIG